MLRRHFMINTESSIPDIADIPDNEIWYTSSDGNIITPTNTESLPTIVSNTYNGRKGIIKFETDVTTIEYRAFKGCSSLIYIIIPNSVTSIGEEAFYMCSSLTSVAIGESVTNIGTWAFRSCSSITSVHITDIAAWCNINFNDYDGNPLYYAHKLYLNGELVKDLVIPNNTTSIGNYAFWNCSLTSVTIPDSVTNIGNNAFSECSSLTSVTIGNGVTSIGTAAFGKCTSLTSISIPDSVTNIGQNAFLDIPNIEYHGTATGTPWGAKNVNKYVEGNLVYEDYTKTTLLVCSHSAQGEIIIPDSVTSIKSKAFYDCIYLTSVIIGNGITSIEKLTFYGCESLTHVAIPDSVTSVGTAAFDGCTSLTSPVCNTHYFAYMPKSYSGAYAIPEGIKQIASSAFSACDSLTSITIPDSTTNIGSDAFGIITAKILFSKLYSTYTNKIITAPTLSISVTCNVEFNISEIPTDYNISSMLPNNGSKGTITYNVYTDYAPCKDQALALVNDKTIVNVYRIDGTPWT